VCHILGGKFDLPHAPTHAILLPHVMAFNAPFAPHMVSALKGVCGVGNPWTALWTLQKSLPMSRALADLGMTQPNIADAVEDVMAAGAYANPRPVDATTLGQLLRRAWHGQPPTVPTPARERSAAGRTMS
jgi:maleylacetate reductase